MTVHELGMKLREMYEMEGIQKTTVFPLFGILYADEIKNAGIKPIEIVQCAQIKASLAREIYKGINLAQYVELKNAYVGKF